MPCPPNTPLGRFGIETTEQGRDQCVAYIPAGGMVNPITGAPTIAPLVMLVDHIGGLTNHSRRVAETRAVGADGRVALVARLTAYR